MNTQKYLKRKGSLAALTAVYNGENPKQELTITAETYKTRIEEAEQAGLLQQGNPHQLTEKGKELIEQAKKSGFQPAKYLQVTKEIKQMTDRKQEIRGQVAEVLK